MHRRLTERERDLRDLKILELIDDGFTQGQAAKRFGLTRSPVSRMIRAIREDERKNNGDA